MQQGEGRGLDKSRGSQRSCGRVGQTGLRSGRVSIWTCVVPKRA